MNPGVQLKNALKNKLAIGAVDNCPGASVAIGKAVYGSIQDDAHETKVTPGAARKDLVNLVWFGGTLSQTAVWHFMVLGAPDPGSSRPAVHHFVVVPWYNQSPPGWSYTVFMAYENSYTIRQYTQSAPGNMAQALRSGYREEWSASEFADMLSDLLANPAAWGDYFLHGASKGVQSISCYKYAAISVEAALANVARYQG
jgi:hypothetical protein